MGRRLLLAGILLLWSLAAADSGKELLDAASQGRTERVRELVDKGAALESKDKNGRTALMLAAQHGHGNTVQVLLEKGANASAKDQNGATAWALATFSPAAQRPAAEEAAKLLPQPAKPRIAVEAGWNASNLYSSCTVRLDQLARNVGELQPDLLALSAFRRFQATAGKDLMEIAAANGRGAGPVPDNDVFAAVDAVLVVLVRPAASCQAQQAADNLGLTIDIQLLRAKDRAVLLHKTLGGGMKGLHVRTVANQTQYFPVYEELVKSHVDEIYWAAVEAWYRAG